MPFPSPAPQSHSPINSHRDFLKMFIKSYYSFLKKSPKSPYCHWHVIPNSYHVPQSSTPWKRHFQGVFCFSHSVSVTPSFLLLLIGQACTFVRVFAFVVFYAWNPLLPDVSGSISPFRSQSNCQLLREASLKILLKVSVSSTFSYDPILFSSEVLSCIYVYYVYMIAFSF